MSSDDLLIDVAKEKIAARIKMEDGTVYQVKSPNFEELKMFEKLSKDKDEEGNEDGLLKVFDALGLPIAAGKQLPMRVLHKVAEKIRGEAQEKK